MSDDDMWQQGELDTALEAFKRNSMESYYTWESRALAVAVNIMKIEDRDGARGKWRRWWRHKAKVVAGI